MNSIIKLEIKKNISYFINGAFLCLIILMILSCSRKPMAWENLKEKDCANYTFGRIESKRMLSDEDKTSLEKQGIVIQEFVLENQYLGSWKSSWNSVTLDKTPINALVKFETKDKLASGMEMTHFEEISNSPGSSMVLLQTLASVDSLELVFYGEILFHRDHFYRMVIPHPQLQELLNYPCLRLLSIVKEHYEPDSGKQ